MFVPAVGGLSILETERKLVSSEVWTKLRTYFSKAPEFTENQEPCQQCLVSGHSRLSSGALKWSLAVIMHSTVFPAIEGFDVAYL